MNQLTKLIKLFSLLLIFSAATAQLQAQEDSRTKLIREIINEKIRIGAENPLHDQLPESLLEDRNNEEHKFTTSTATTSYEAEPFIAINPTDTNNIVASFMILDGSTGELTFPIYYSLDAGDTWNLSNFDAPEIFIDDTPDLQIGGGGDPLLAFDSDGKLYYSWLYLGLEGFTLEGKFHVYWAYSDNKGQSFILENGEDHFIAKGQINLLSGATADYGDGVFDRPWFDIDLSDGPYSNSLYCSGLFLPNNITDWDGNGMVLKYKRANETTFEDLNVQISPNANVQFGNVRVDGDGNVHFSYGDLDSGTVKHSVSSDGGETFSTPGNVGNFQYVLGGAKLVHDRENPVPNMVVDRNTNDIYIVWSSYEGSTVKGYFAKSTDLGATWTSELNLATLMSTTTDQCLMPTIAINDAGAISISWYVLDAADEGHYYVVESEDGGNTFETPIQASTEITDFSVYPAGNLLNPAAFFGDYNSSARTGCKTYSLWSDGRNNQGPKMYLAITDHCSGVIAVQERIPITDQIALTQLYPNPVIDNCNLSLELKGSSNIQIAITNIEGKLVKMVYNSDLGIGNHNIELDLKELVPGMYGLVVYSDFGAITKKLIKE